MLSQRIADALKDAMKAQDKARLSALRLVSAAIKNAEIEARTQGKDAPGDEALMGLLQKLIKQRQELAELYDKGGAGGTCRRASAPRSWSSSRSCRSR